ncbi:MAG: glycosyltransferase [Chloroflexota bacterium]
MPHPKDDMFLSVIIPAFNEEMYLEQTLERIKSALDENERMDLSWELIVCDNNSGDKTSEIASAFGARVIFEPINQISRARNRGASIAKGEWLLFIDADSYPEPALIAEMIDRIRSRKIIGCGTTVRVKGGTLFNKLRMERVNPFFRLFGLSGGAFLLCQADAFRAIDGFSTDLYAYEEIDFIIRLKRHGRKVGKRFAVMHQHPVVTSGRKGDVGLRSLGLLYLSNFSAVVLLLLYYLVPASLVRWLGNRLLGYWYPRRR